MSAPLTTQTKPKSSRKRQWTILAGIAIAGIGLLYLILVLSAARKPAPTVRADLGPAVRSSIQVPGDTVTPVERWVGDAGARMNDQQVELKKQADKQAEFTKKFQDLEDRLNKGGAPGAVPGAPAGSDPTAASPVPNSTTPSLIGNLLKLPPPQAASTTPATPAHPPVYPPAEDLPSANKGRALPPLPNGTGAPPSSMDPALVAAMQNQANAPRLGHVSLNEDGPAAPAINGAKAGTATANTGSASGSDKSGETGHDADSYLPVGMLKVTLLGGMDAPTSGSGQSNPLPVIMKVTDLAILPNRARANVKECFVIGAGYGDLSSERAYIRTETLSCVNVQGHSVLEVKLSGVAFGEDGKLGLRGRLVSKQGAAIANSLFAGIIGGIGQAISFKTTTTQMSALGTTITQANPGQEMEAGLGQGVNTALTRLSKYYMDLAEKTFPVIEIDARRNVDIAMTAGTVLDSPLPGTRIEPQATKKGAFNGDD